MAEAIAEKIEQDPNLTKEICDALASRQYPFGEAIQVELDQSLCSP
jgi:hypothetical protein